MDISQQGNSVAMLGFPSNGLATEKYVYPLRKEAAASSRSAYANRRNIGRPDKGH